MARKDWKHTLYDFVTDLANFFGIGNLWDKMNTDSPETIYSDLLKYINENFDKISSKTKSNTNKLNLILQDLMINSPSPTFKGKIDAVKRRINNQLDLQSDISDAVVSAREVATAKANQILNNTNRTAGWLKDDIKKEIDDIAKDTIEIVDQINNKVKVGDLNNEV